MPFVFPPYGDPLYDRAVTQGLRVEPVRDDDAIRSLLPQMIPDIRNPPPFDEDLFAGYVFKEVVDDAVRQRPLLGWDVARSIGNRFADTVAVFQTRCDRKFHQHYQDTYMRRILPRDFPVRLVCQEDTRTFTRDIQMNEMIYRTFTRIHDPEHPPSIYLLLQRIYDTDAQNLDYAFYWAERLIDLLHLPTLSTISEIPEDELQRATDGVNTPLNCIVPEYFEYPEELSRVMHTLILDCARMTNERVIRMGDRFPVDAAGGGP